ncbi:MAG: ISL3 family transposase, partial [Desulfobacterales bacterium]|nr:ISL3 family transposase [Desulfobacterales bacterium]
MNSEIVIVRLRRHRKYKLTCPICNQRARENRVVRQAAKDLPLGTVNLVEIIYEAVQGYCRSCKTYFTALPPGIDNNAKATRRLMHYVCRLCRFMPVDKIPFFLPMSTSTARRWDKKILSEYLPDPDLDNLRVILVDEKSIGSHHHYVTVVINGDTGEVLHLAEGKKKESLSAFFDKLTAEQILNIKAVGMDRAGAYKSVVSQYAPKAAIVFDKFHLVANYNHAIDNVRRSQWREAEEEHKSFIKGQRYNLFRNPENLKPEQKASLQELLNINEPLFKAYVLKDSLKKLWSYVYTRSAEKYLDKWISLANESELKHLVSFAKGLDRDRKEILSFIRHRITSAKLEAFNATISR